MVDQIIRHYLTDSATPFQKVSFYTFIQAFSNFRTGALLWFLWLLKLCLDLIYPASFQECIPNFRSRNRLVITRSKLVIMRSLLVKIRNQLVLIRYHLSQLFIRRTQLFITRIQLVNKMRNERCNNKDQCHWLKQIAEK